MKSGKSVILEWGYSYEKNDINLMDIKDLNYKTIYKRFIEKAFNSGGTYDGMMGVITTWEWSVADDGYIDCTTNISSMGLDILKQQTTPVDDINISQTTKSSASSTEDQKQTVPTMTFNKFLEDIHDKLTFQIADASQSGNPISNVAFLDGKLYMSWG